MRIWDTEYPAKSIYDLKCSLYRIIPVSVPEVPIWEFSAMQLWSLVNLQVDTVSRKPRVQQMWTGMQKAEDNS